MSSQKEAPRVSAVCASPTRSGPLPGTTILGIVGRPPSSKKRANHVDARIGRRERNPRPDAAAQPLIHPISYFALAQADHSGVDGDDQVAVAGFLSALY